MCLDNKTDCLFTHEVTVMPSDNGGLKYLGFKTTYKSQIEPSFKRTAYTDAENNARAREQMIIETERESISDSRLSKLDSKNIM